MRGDVASGLRRDSLYFVGPRQVEVRTEEVPHPAMGQVLIQTLVSAISAGTEMLFYRNQVPADIPVDANLSGYDQAFAYPLQYGYAAVGRVIELGPGVDSNWLNQRVFAFQPHQSHFLLAAENAIVVPTALPDSRAAFLPNMETAVMLVMDARPMVGERVVVMGLGVVGLLVTSLLARFPLEHLAALDPVAARRHRAQAWGAHQTFDPATQGVLDARSVSDPDLILELSGNPAALDLAVQMAGVETRIVVGSWYGAKSASLALGSTFHRNRISITSSQVSSLASAHSGRWSKARRLNVAWTMLQQIAVDELVTHRYPLAQCARAYDQIDTGANETLQVLFTYGDT